MKKTFITAFLGFFMAVAFMVSPPTWAASWILISSAVAAVWGTVTGTLSSQNDLQSALDAKAPTASPTFTTKTTHSYATASTVPYFNASKELVSSAVTPTQLGYLDATSSIQTQLNTKGDASGPASSVSTTMCTYSGTGGKTLANPIDNLTWSQSSGNVTATVGASGNLAIVANAINITTDRIQFSSGVKLNNGGGLGNSGDNFVMTTTETYVERPLRPASSLESTGAGTALLGANSPAVTLSAPYKWIKFLANDGSTMYVPAWK